MFFLRLGAVSQNVGRNDFIVQAVTNAAEARAAQLFHLDHAVELVGPGTAIFLGHGHAQKAVFAGLVPNGPVHVALVFPGLVEWRYFLGDKAAEAIAEGFVFGGEEAAFDHHVS